MCARTRNGWQAEKDLRVAGGMYGTGSPMRLLRLKAPWTGQGGNVRGTTGFCRAMGLRTDGSGWGTSGSCRTAVSRTDGPGWGSSGSCRVIDLSLDWSGWGLVGTCRATDSRIDGSGWGPTKFVLGCGRRGPFIVLCCTFYSLPHSLNKPTDAFLLLPFSKDKNKQRNTGCGRCIHSYIFKWVFCCFFTSKLTTMLAGRTQFQP